MALPTSSPPPKDLRFILDGFRETLHNNLYSFWKTSQFCDLVLQMSDGVVHAHSCLLAAFSPTIAEMLSTLDSYFSDKGKYSQRVVTIEVDHLSTESLNSVIEAMYTGQVEASSENISNILDTVRWLKIEHLISAIEQTCKEEMIADEANEMGDVDVDNSNSYKVVIGNDNIHSTYFEELKTKDVKTLSSPNSVTLSPHTAPPLHKELDSKCDDVLQQRTKSDELMRSTTMSLRSSNVKDKSKVYLNPSINAKIINQSCPSALSDKGNSIHGADTTPTECALDDENVETNSGYTDAEDYTSNGINQVEKKSNESKSKRTSLKVLVTNVSKTSEIDQLSSGSTETLNVTKGVTAHEKKRPNETGGKATNTPSQKTKGSITEIMNKADKDETSLQLLKCDKCKCKFEDGTKYFEHIQNHPPPSYSCTECSKSFYTKLSRTRHQFVEHLQNKHLICDECSFQARTGRELCEHSTKEHDQMKPFRCRHFGCIFRSHSFYLVKKHMDQSHAEKTKLTVKKQITDVAIPFVNSDDNLKTQKNFYKCIKCPLRFSNHDEFKKHTRDHPVFSCPECPLNFTSKQYMSTHRFTCHLQNKHLICDICSYQANTGKNLRLHSIEKHNQPKPFSCKYPECTYRSDYYYNIENHKEAIHLKTKTKEKKHECSHCGKKYSNSFYLEDHIRVCLRLEEFLCDFCGEAFNKKCYLDGHKNAVHYKNRNFKCKECPKSFGRRATLAKHMVVHKDIFPYPCLYCSKVFRRPSGIKNHMKAMHKDIAYTTKAVNKNYKYKGPTQQKPKSKSKRSQVNWL